MKTRERNIHVHQMLLTPAQLVKKFRTTKVKFMRKCSVIKHFGRHKESNTFNNRSGKYDIPYNKRPKQSMAFCNN